MSIVTYNKEPWYKKHELKYQPYLDKATPVIAWFKDYKSFSMDTIAEILNWTVIAIYLINVPKYAYIGYTEDNIYAISLSMLNLITVAFFYLFTDTAKSFKKYRKLAALQQEDLLKLADRMIEDLNQSTITIEELRGENEKLRKDIDRLKGR